MAKHCYKNMDELYHAFIYNEDPAGYGYVSTTVWDMHRRIWVRSREFIGNKLYSVGCLVAAIHIHNGTKFVFINNWIHTDYHTNGTWQLRKAIPTEMVTIYTNNEWLNGVESIDAMMYAMVDSLMRQSKRVSRCGFNNYNWLKSSLHDQIKDMAYFISLFDIDLNKFEHHSPWYEYYKQGILNNTITESNLFPTQAKREVAFKNHNIIVEKRNKLKAERRFKEVEIQRLRTISDNNNPKKFSPLHNSNGVTNQDDYYMGYYPKSIHRVRINENTIQTSGYATLHKLKAPMIWKLLCESYKLYTQTHERITSIDKRSQILFAPFNFNYIDFKTGIMSIGCHLISILSIRELARELGYKDIWGKF